MKVFAFPALNDTVEWLVMTAGWETTRVKLWGVLPAALVAVNVIGYEPPVPDAGVPESVPVAGLNVTPFGSAPVSANAEPGAARRRWRQRR